MITQEQIKDLRQRVETLARCLNIEKRRDIGNRRSEVKRMEEESQTPGFWDDPKSAEGFLKKMNSVKVWVSSFDALSGAADDVDVLMELDPELALPQHRALKTQLDLYLQYRDKTAWRRRRQPRRGADHQFRCRWY